MVEAAGRTDARGCVERTGTVVKPRTLDREVPGSSPPLPEVIIRN